MDRRTFLGIAAAAAARGQGTPTPIIDTHIHLFDPTRPQGVPWPEKSDAVLYRPALPDRYRQLAVPLGIRGAVAIECSPWLEDNQWLLDTAATDSIIVGVVGNLEPAAPEFAAHLERFHRNPLFLGIRYGNLWGRSLANQSTRPTFIAGLKLLANANLVLDTANPDPPLLRGVLRVASAVPNLRIIIDHLPQLQPPDSTVLRELANIPTLYVKISEVLRRTNGSVPLDVSYYRATLDLLLETFGEDRLFYGSDWPNSDQWAPYASVLKIVRDYFTTKGPQVAAKYFHQNSQAAYNWKQPTPARSHKLR